MSSSGQPGKAFAGRYDLRGELGRGAMGVVHRAWDPVTQSEVALKVLQTHAAPLSTLRKEFAVAAELQHPNVIAVYDFGARGTGPPYFTMEVVDAQPLSDVQLDTADLLRVTLQTLDALAYLASRNLVHGDIKPSNLLISRSPGDGIAAKLVDFGLAAQSPDGAGISGTPAYMAPEVASGQPATALSDLYSLGVVLYEGLSGSNPFFDDDIGICLDRHKHHCPPTLSRLDVGINGPLSEFVARLIEKRHTRRFESPGEAARTLRTIAADETREAGSVSVRTPPLIGREAALETIDEALDDIAAGIGSVLAVTGCAGGGSTRLTENARIRAQLRGTACGVIRCRPGDDDLAALHRALDMAFGTSAAQRGWRERVDQRDQREPLVLVVDDAQLASRPLFLALSELAGDAREANLLLIVTDPDGAQGVLHTTIVAAIAGGYGRRVHCGPLELAQTRRLIETCLGGSIDDETLTKPLHSATRGVVRDIMVLLSHAAVTDRLVSQSGIWSDRDPAAVSSDGRSPIELVLETRFVALEDSQKRVLEVVAVTGDVDAPGLAQLTSLQDSDITEALSALCASHLVIGDSTAAETRYLPAQPPLAVVVKRQLGDDKWAQLHARAFDVLVDQADESRLALHACAAKRIEAAVVLTRRAALAQCADGFPDRGLKLRQMLVALLEADAPTHTARAEVLSETGLTFASLGRYEEALEHLEQSVDLAGTPSNDTLRESVEIRARLGRTDSARADVTQLLAVASGLNRPTERARSRLTAARTLRLVGELDDARRELTLAQAEVDDEADLVLSADLLRELATLDWMQGLTDDATRRATDSLARYERAGDRLRYADGAMALGTSYRTAGNYSKAVPLYAEATEIYRRRGALASLGKALNNFGVCHYLLGDIDGAAETWGEAIRLAAVTGEQVEAVILSNNLGFMYLERGLLDQADAALTQALSIAEQVDATRLRVVALGNLGEVRAAQSRIGEARDAYQAAIALAVSIDARGDVVENRRRLASLALADGDLSSAEASAAEALDEATALGLTAEIAQLERIVGLAAIRSGRRDAAAAALERAEKTKTADDGGVVGLRLLLARAELALMDGDLATALRLAERALEGFSSQKANTDIEAARALADQIKARMPNEVPGDDGALSGLVTALHGSWKARVCAKTVLSHLVGKVGAQRGTVVIEPSSHHDGLRLSVNAPGSRRSRGKNVNFLSRTVADRVLQEGKPICLQNVDDDLDVATAESVIQMELCSLLCVPVPLEDRSRALIYLDSQLPTGESFGSALPHVETVAALLGMALDRIWLRQRLAAQTDVVAVVAHELRSPLTAILGFGELASVRLGDQKVPALVTSLIEAVNDQGERMKRMISDVQALGRAWRYNLDQAQSILPDALLLDSVHALQPAAHQAQVTLDLVASNGLPNVRADQNRFRQVIDNLVGNALRYAPMGTTVTLRAERAPFGAMVGERRAIRFSVRDHGPGLTPEDIESIFQKFQRGSKPRGDGSGLGLNIARAIIQAHGGRIWVENAAGGGCCFYFTIPVADDSPSAPLIDRNFSKNSRAQ